MNADVTFLSSGFTKVVEVYCKKFNTPDQTLKDANWEVVEYQTLLEEAQSLKNIYEGCILMVALAAWNERQRASCKATLQDNHAKGRGYIRNLFKKKRVAGDHIVVVMVSDEKRKKKSYALPVKFIPCTQGGTQLSESSLNYDPPIYDITFGCGVAALLSCEAQRLTPNAIWFPCYFYPQANGIMDLECREC